MACEQIVDTSALGGEARVFPAGMHKKFKDVLFD
jgi:hypothetical protein